MATADVASHCSLRCFACAILVAQLGFAEAPSTLPGTKPLQDQGDMSARMVAGIDAFLARETERSAKERARFYNRDLSSVEAYERSILPNRERLRAILGVIDKRAPAPELITSPLQVSLPRTSQETKANIRADAGPSELAFDIETVRWTVFPGVHGEGLRLTPKRKVIARVVALADADQTPEMIAGLASSVDPERQFARRLAENGCEVLIPVLLNRKDEFSGNTNIQRFTNQPHREWIYRQAYELGRHIIGYEVQKVLAAVDCFESRSAGGEKLPIGVAGYAEGGLLAFYAAALDTRINAAMVSGYFDSRQQLWREPIYRNVFGLLEQFGDAEVVTLIAPRALVVEHSAVPKVEGPPPARPGRSGAAPGRLVTPDYETLELELQRARSLLRNKPQFDKMTLIAGTEGMTTGPASDRALEAFLRGLGITVELPRPGAPLSVSSEVPFDAVARQARQIAELQEFTQNLLSVATSNRNEFFWSHATSNSPEDWVQASRGLRSALATNLIGAFNQPLLPLNAHTRAAVERTNWTGYEYKLDVYPDVFAWGYLLLPSHMKAGERRPVVVCKHGLEGLPTDVINEDPKAEGFGFYKGFASRLAAEGFVVVAPHNPYRGGDSFRVLQRKANPLGKSLFSFIDAQHEQLLNWLQTLPFVDANRIGFYGLSYGGKTAMRVPAVLERYALSICSGDFNDWIRKNVSVDFPASYMFTGEWEMPEWNFGNTFNYAEMAALIAPRPFMVERGHSDPVGVDEWVLGEYGRVRAFYSQLGIPDQTRIELFDGRHTINGKGTFEFLKEKLNWPAR